jgi:hypothetical protein
MPKRSRRSGGGGKNRSKKQKMYDMKGCSKTARLTKTASKSRSKSANKSRSKKLIGGQGCGSSACPIAPYSWKQMQQQGGSCASRGLMSGGRLYQSPGPFVGQAWSPSVAGWPGVNGIGGDRNYLANNLYKADPQTMMKLGGKRMNKRMKRRVQKLKGGGLIPQNLVNLGRDASFNFKSAYNALNGYSAPINSLPYKDQLSGSMSTNRIII